MITDHRFVGLRQWGIDPPPLSTCQHAGCGLPRNQHATTCTGVLTIKGQAFSCDLVMPHDGWAHSNTEAEALWGEST